MPFVRIKRLQRYPVLLGLTRLLFLAVHAHAEPAPPTQTRQRRRRPQSPASSNR